MKSIRNSQSEIRNSNLPIGIFDSGVGGLTVYRALHEHLPNEHFVYLGDTARVPYGTKSLATVERYAVENAQFLAARGIKLLVVACNTASALTRAKQEHAQFLIIQTALASACLARLKAGLLVEAFSLQHGFGKAAGLGEVDRRARRFF